MFVHVFFIMDLSFSIEEWECLFSVLPWFSHLLTIYGFWSRLDIFWFYLLEEFEVPSENYQCIFSMCKLCLSMSFFCFFSLSKITIYADEHSGHRLGYGQKCGGVKPINSTSTLLLFLLIIGCLRKYNI